MRAEANTAKQMEQHRGSTFAYDPDMSWQEHCEAEMKATRKHAAQRGVKIMPARHEMAEATASASSTGLCNGDAVALRGFGHRGELDGLSGTVVHDKPDAHGRICVLVGSSKENTVLDGGAPSKPATQQKVMRILADRLQPEGHIAGPAAVVVRPDQRGGASRLGFTGFGLVQPSRVNSTGALLPPRTLNRAFKRTQVGGFYVEDADLS